MEVVKFLSTYVMFIGPLISISLLIWGKCKQINLLNPLIPLGRTQYLVGNFSAIFVGIFSFQFITAVHNSMSLSESLVYLFVEYFFFIYAVTAFFSTGMRRAVDMGLPYWAYPLFLIILGLSSYISTEVMSFLALGHWLFLLQPGIQKNI